MWNVLQQIIANIFFRGETASERQQDFVFVNPFHLRMMFKFIIYLFFLSNLFN